MSGRRAFHTEGRANAKSQSKRVLDGVTNRSDWLKQKWARDRVVDEIGISPIK